MQSDKIVNGMVSATTVSISALSILLVLFLLIQAFILNNAYVYGQELQKRCGIKYLEKETAHYQIHQIFIEKVQNNFDKIFMAFALIFIVVISLLVILFLFILLKIEIYQWVESKLLLTMGTISAGLCLAGSMYYVSKDIVKTNKNYYYLFFILIIPIIINAILGQWFINTYWFAQLFFILIILIPLLLLFAFILFVWISTVANKTNKYFNFISPFSKPTLPINSVVLSQYIHIGSILLTGVYFYLYFSKILFISEGPMYKLLTISLIITVILFALLPIISYFMYTIKYNNAAYAERIKQINDMLRKIVGSNEDPVMINGLLRNIINYDSIKNPNVDPSDILNNPDTSLVDYLKHSENYIDISSISIPSRLEEYIQPSYLTGDRLFSLKQALVNFHHDKDGTTYNLNNVKTHYHINTKTTVGYDKELSQLTYYLNQRKYNNLYTLQDILMETNIEQTAKENIKKQFLETLNNTVINSNQFHNVDPMSREIYTQLRDLRNNNTLESDTVSFYKIAKGIIFSGLVIGSYVIFHKVYSQNPVLAGQTISAALLLTIIIVSYIAFFTKDTWL